MAPPKRDWSSKRGYIVNAMKKRKLAGAEKRKAEDSVGDRPPVKLAAAQEDYVEDDSTPDVSDREDSPSYSPHESDHSAEMDTSELNAAADYAGAGTLGAGTESGGARYGRSAAGGRGGMPTSSGGGLRGQAVLPRGIRQDTMREIRTYRKQYLFRIQNEAVEIGHRYDPAITTATATQITVANPTRYGSVGVIRYPYHDIPVNMLAFYLTAAEMHSLSYFSQCRVLSAKCDVYNKTGVLNFETAASNASIGNNNVGIYLNQISSDIGDKRCGQLPDVVPLIEERVWGETYAAQKEKKEFTTINVSLLGARYVRRTLSNKFEYFSPMNNSLDYDFTKDTYTANGVNVNNNVPGMVPYFNINPFIEKRVNASMNEGLFTQWHYKPIDGLVSGNFSIGPNSVIYRQKFNTKSRMPMKQNSLAYENLGKVTEQNPLTNMQGNSFEDTNISDTFVPGQLPYTKSADVMTQIDRVEVTGKQVPPLIIGIEPLVSEIPTNTSNKWEIVKCFVDLYIDVELQMECSYGFDYIDPSIPSVPANFMKPEMMVRGPKNTIFIPNAEDRDINCRNIPVQAINRNERQNVPSFPNSTHPLARTRRTERSFSAYSVPMTRSKTAAAAANTPTGSKRSKVTLSEPPPLQSDDQQQQQQQPTYDYKTGRYTR